MFVDKESEAGEDLEAMLARSQSSRHYPRTNLGLEDAFQRNTPRSKSLGRPKGTRLQLMQHRDGSLTPPSRVLFGIFGVSLLLGGGRKTFRSFLGTFTYYVRFLYQDIHIIRHYCRRVHLQSKNYEEFILRGTMM